MSTPRTLQGGRAFPPRQRTREEWEEWDDEEMVTPIEDGEALLSPGLDSPSKMSSRSARWSGQQRSPIGAARHSMQKIKRLKSRQRQKAQNAKAGIKLVTDMSVLRQQQEQKNTESRTGRYVDAAALNALEGAPAKKKQPQGLLRNKRLDMLVAEAPSQADISPIVGPIMIGFAMPSDSDVVISPQTAVVQTPIEFPIHFKKPTQAPPSKLQILPSSVWSPDTEDGNTSTARQNLAGIASPDGKPATRSVPRGQRNTRATSIFVSDDEDDAPTPRGTRHKRDTKTTTFQVSDEEDDMDTPVTLFEEDGTTPVNTRQKSFRARRQSRSTVGGHTRSQGWWDQVTSPFGPRSPAKQQSPIPHSPETENQGLWKDTDNKSSTPTSKYNPGVASGSRTPAARARPPPSIVIEDVSSQPASAPRTRTPVASRAQTQADKVNIIVEEEELQVEMPPPYSPPSTKDNVRYRAVFPPGHPLTTTSRYPPSPGPVSPAMARTMTSQGAISLTNVPLTPPASTFDAPRRAYLPNRAPGSVVRDHFLSVSGHGPRQKAERQRRRHEKEEATARKVGGFWRGRGCIPESGCFGRSGREGRKRRRVCLGVCGGILGLIILAIVLGVTLSRRASTASTPFSPFLNLTDFPPIPTGIATVVGPNTDATTACVQPASLWSCSLPKEQASSVARFGADQPTFVFQIQFDNNTRQLWNVTGQEPPVPTPTKASSTSSATATSTRRPQARGEAIGVLPFLRKRVSARQDDASAAPNDGFTPDPAPPNFQDMFFLGNTTDGVVSDEKAGEPTPFYISMLRSVDESVGPNTLSRRAGAASVTAPKINVSDSAPPPVLNPDGTGAPAVLFPFPKQQPLRLYDRGLPTERFGFYTYYNKTIYVKSVAVPNDNSASGQVADDLNGGALESEAKFLVTWLSARFKVEIWTRRENTTRLNGGRVSDDNATQPGTFPYPVTVTLDTHGGIPGQKFAFARGVVDQRVVTNDATFVLNFMSVNGNLVNPSSNFNPSFGGMDGGNGGCQCAYSNFVRLNGKATAAAV
ncbi:hypothetical protein B0H66DRAFT_527577 [Apodospora peruviana]|uniref:Glycoprotease family protein n=1 Tax=Apodospora peruviana TaxID=516989 RepID=A0AAE0MF28_9PEZI|nr:hypothetical protein B0H66DRAFT_527577 [Apodospora peruviana]